MKRYYTLVLIAVALLFAMSIVSCGGDGDGGDDNVDPDPQPQDTCQTQGITYKNFVEDLVSQQCRACHNSTQIAGGLKLTTYQDVNIIASNGSMIHAINGTEGYAKMPPAPAPELKECDVKKLEAWINAAMPEE